MTIPQDPVELPGSVRYNLGQFTSSSASDDDRAMERALIRVNLRDTIKKRDGLDSELVKCGIVLLDESASSVSDDTDVVVRRIVRKDSAGYAISHNHR